MNRARATDDAGNCIASQRSMAAYREILRLRVSWSAITAPHVARDAVRVLDRARSPGAVPTPAANSAPICPSAPAIPASAAKDWRNSPDEPVTN